MYPAHIREDGAVQTVKEHCLNTAKTAEKDMRGLGLGNCAYLAGLLHDSGKCTEEFREYIQKAANGEPAKKGSVIHTFAGVRFLMKTYHVGNPMQMLTAEILSSAIGGHHGLFDCFDENSTCGFSHRTEKQPKIDDLAIKNFFEEVTDRKTADLIFSKSVEEISEVFGKIKKYGQTPEEIFFFIALLTRLITSAVIDADRFDTASFLSPGKTAEEKTASSEMWSKLSDNYDKYISGFGKDSPIAVARQKLSDRCFESADDSDGIYRLNLPTGAGKTLSGLRYALRHAEKYNKKRIFFISPLLSILEQNAAEIRKAVGDDSVILEHHSDIVSEEKTAEELNRYELLTDRWNIPIVITTLAQFLNTLFSGKTTSVRRFQSLADSVIVIDEVQTVPLKTLSLFNSAMNFLSKICNTTVVLCSATQPEFEETNHPLLPCKDIVKKEELKKYKDIFKRNTIEYKGKRNLSEVPELISELFDNHRSVLVVCNKKDQATELFDITENICKNRYHLSAGMCIAHRKKVLADIKKELGSNSEKILCISTQVIEAGVDISFDAVIRLCAGLDSIVQAAGRCNRNGENGDLSPVWIVNCKDENLNGLKDIHDAKDAAEALLDNFERNPEAFKNDLSSEKSVSHYYKKLFLPKKDSNFFDYVVNSKPSIYSLLSDNKQYTSESEGGNYCLHQAFKTAGELFKVFDDGQTSVIVPWQDGREIIKKIYAEGKYITKKTVDLAKPYTVSVYSYQFENLRNCGAICEVADSGIYTLNENFYDENTGIKKGENSCGILIV